MSVATHYSCYTDEKKTGDKRNLVLQNDVENTIEGASKQQKKDILRIRKRLLKFLGHIPCRERSENLTLTGHQRQKGRGALAVDLQDELL